MHPKIKQRPAGKKIPRTSVKPLLLHDVTNLAASANLASRHAVVSNQPASGMANHARHHISPKSQS